ncbi:MAG TPA: hypothetical protein VFA39_06575 [Steroidobacteraceae bacterium]|nr:hypothetical protein [Steroidobacteraceae bacterium]
MQRLPFHRIQRAQKVGEIVLEKNPGATGLGSGDEATFGSSADFLGVHAQEGGRLIEIECFHGAKDT